MKLSFCAACGSKDDLQHNHLVMRSEVASAYLAALGAQLLSLREQISEFDRMITAWHRSNQTSKRLHYIPGSAPWWQPPWSRVLLTPELFQGVTSRPGLASSPNSTQVGARSGSAASVNPLSAQPVRGWSTRPHPLRQDPWHPASALAHGVVGPATDQGRRHCARQ